MAEEVLRVTATDAALALIERLATKHGPLMFHQSGFTGGVGGILPCVF